MRVLSLYLAEINLYHRSPRYQKLTEGIFTYFTTTQSGTDGPAFQLTTVSCCRSNTLAVNYISCPSSLKIFATEPTLQLRWRWILKQGWGPPMTRKLRIAEQCLNFIFILSYLIWLRWRLTRRWNFDSLNRRTFLVVIYSGSVFPTWSRDYSDIFRLRKVRMIFSGLRLNFRWGRYLCRI